MADRPTVKITRSELNKLAADVNSNATVADAVAMSMAVIHYLTLVDPYSIDEITALTDFYAERFGGTVYEITDDEDTSTSEA